MEFPDGLYDLILSQAQAQRLAAETQDTQRTTVPLSADESAERLAESIASQLAAILDDVTGDNQEKLARQLELVNGLLVETRRRLAAPDDTLGILTSPPTALRSVHRSLAAPTPPDTGLSAPWIFTAGKGSPSLLNELRRELSACDRVDILVSFITLSGVRKLFDILKAITAVGANGRARTRIRVLTTTYTGATEVGALDELAKLPGCEVKVSLDVGGVVEPRHFGGGRGLAASRRRS